MPAPSTTGSVCAHCGNALGAGSVGAYCCAGCQLVHELLHEEGLERYYDLRGGAGLPAAAASEAGVDELWLEPVVASITKATAGGATRAARVELDIQGVHCAGCVWLLEKLFRRCEGALSIELNPAAGRLSLLVTERFPLRDYVRDAARFGYRLGPARPGGQADEGDGLVFRLGFAVAVAMNSMIFAIAVYAGLREGPLHRLFLALNLGLTALSVVVSGTYFLRSAFEALRRGILHLDLPIALGIVLAFAGSVWGSLTGREGAVFFDTLNVFVALMLAGRFVQERTLRRSRRLLLQDGGEDAVLARTLDGDVPRVTRASEVRAGDALLVSPGDIVVTDAVLLREAASFSLDWINGESEPVRYEPGELVPAGATLATSRSARLEATQAFADSALRRLLRAKSVHDGEGARQTRPWQLLARYYVVGVLAVAALGALGWGLFGRDPARALEVATALLVVTCPCAFGLATPLAYEMVLASLRRAGLVVRSPSFLDRAVDVRAVVFDKTGTLTTGALDASELGELDAHDRAVALALAMTSSHPRALAVARLLTAQGVRPAALAQVEEHAGQGLQGLDGEQVVRLGSAAFALAEGAAAGASEATILSRDGRAVGAFELGETLRPDAAREVAALRAEGLDVWVLSGDHAARTVALAREAGVAEGQALGDQRPDDKAAWLTAHDRGHVLMVGDGINDAKALSLAHCAGTPSIERPFVAGRSDFYLLSPGLGPIRAALSAARRLREVTSHNLALALAYNAVTIGIALAGLMSPLLAAVLMPVSSLVTLAYTTRALGPRDAARAAERAAPLPATP